MQGNGDDTIWGTHPGHDRMKLENHNESKAGYPVALVVFEQITSGI
jgi:hypothetical protein